MDRDSADMFLQRAIYDSLWNQKNWFHAPTNLSFTPDEINLVRSSGSNSRISSSKTVKNNYGNNSKFDTLAREGIGPATVNFCDRSKIERKFNCISKNNKADSRVNDPRTSKLLNASRALIDTNWVQLENNWFQLSPSGSGKFKRCGLHTILESNMDQYFVCLFSPHSRDTTQLLSSDNSDYKIVFELKLFQLSSNNLKYNLFQIILSYKSSSDYLLISFDVSKNTCAIIRYLNGQEYSIFEIMTQCLFPPNIFKLIEISIQNDSLTTSIDERPLFNIEDFHKYISTAVNASEDEKCFNFSGLVGLAVKGCKLVWKNWRIISQRIEPLAPIQALPSPKSTSRSKTTAASSSTSTFIRQQNNMNPATSSLITTTATTTATTPKTKRPSLPLISTNQSKTGITSLPNSNYDNSKKSPSKYSSCLHSLLQQFEPTIAQAVMGDIIQRDLGVTFEDIASLDLAKRLLHEAVALPLLLPEFFTGIREPWKGVLLFGPPGTGKTMLAKAISATTGTTFFSCSASSLVSKYRGDSEKIIRCLFTAARHCAPSTVFLDEVDAVVSSRKEEGEHEASRRMKTELFAQMDGVTSVTDGPKVMVLAATNCPWDLDEAIRRRLEKRIYVPLPDEAARKELFRLHLRGLAVTDEVDVQDLATETQGLSGADIRNLCREAAMAPMRRLLAEKSPAEIQMLRQLRVGEKGSTSSSSLLPTTTIPPVTIQDFQAAISKTKTSVGSETVTKCEEWNNLFGSS